MQEPVYHRVQGAGITYHVQGAGITHHVQGAGIYHGVQGAGIYHGVQGAGITQWCREPGYTPWCRELGIPLGAGAWYTTGCRELVHLQGMVGSLVHLPGMVGSLVHLAGYTSYCTLLGIPHPPSHRLLAVCTSPTRLSVVGRRGPGLKVGDSPGWEALIPLRTLKV